MTHVYLFTGIFTPFTAFSFSLYRTRRNTIYECVSVHLYVAVIEESLFSSIQTKCFKIMNLLLFEVERSTKRKNESSYGFFFLASIFFNFFSLNRNLFYCVCVCVFSSFNDWNSICLSEKPKANGEPKKKKQRREIFSQFVEKWINFCFHQKMISFFLFSFRFSVFLYARKYKKKKLKNKKWRFFCRGLFFKFIYF